MRIAAYNILEGGEDRTEQILRILRSIQPDAVAILEANDRSNVEWLATEMGMHLTFGQANNPYHIAWLTEGAPTTSRNDPHESLAKTLLSIEIDWDGEPITLFAAHLAPHKEDIERRLIESRTILDLIGQRKDSLSVLVGDFNAVPRSSVIDLIGADGFIDCYRAVHGDDDSDTRPVGDRNRRIDYIFGSAAMSEGLVSCAMRTGADAIAASDHYAIWAEFERVGDASAR